MGNYTAGAKTICPFYLKESDKGITCEGVVPGTTQMTRFDSQQDKRRHQKACCERRDYLKLCKLAKLLEQIANDGNTEHADGNTEHGGIQTARLVMVGQKIRKTREQLDLTQSQAARLMCMSRSHLCEIELGRCAPSLDTLIAIATALNTDAGSLLPGGRKREE